MEKELNLLAIGYAKHALQEGSREQQRMADYASELSQYSMIVLTRRKDNLPTLYQKDNLTIYGTNTRTRVGMLYAAYKIGTQSLKENKSSNWVVSSQDPFETGIVGRALSRASNAVHHVQVHGDPFSNPVWRRESFLNRLRFVYGLFVLRSAAAVRVVSKRVQKSLVERGVASDKISIIPIVADMETFLQVGEARTYENKQTCTFLYVGRLAQEKNLQRVLTVFAQAYTQDCTIRLRIVGEGPCRHSLKRKTQVLGITSVVTFIPWTDTVAEEMSQADVFIFASSHEGYAMVLQEAMATGLPVITTDVGCVGDVLIHERDGLVISQKDDVEFVDAVCMLAKDESLRERFGRSGFHMVKKNMIIKQEYIQKWKNSLMIR